MIYVILIFVFILVVGIFLIFKFRKTGKLTGENIKFFNKQLIRIQVNSSSKEQIIDIDKLYHKVLLELGYKGTFGEILKKNPKEIGDINKVWELHKLRNKLVHDFDLLNESTLRDKSKEYNLLLVNLIKQ